MVYFILYSVKKILPKAEHEFELEFMLIWAIIIFFGCFFFSLTSSLDAWSVVCSAYFELLRLDLGDGEEYRKNYL